MTHSLISFITLLTLITSLSLEATNSDQNKDIEKKIEAMTLEEKIAFIGGFESFNIRGFPHLGIPEIHLADGPVGVRNFGKSTAYPASINLAASWDRKLSHRLGQSIAMEAKARNCHILLGPGMNISRMPVCGRNFEYLGEDPFLAGELAKDYIIGMQKEGVMACAKHYAANNQEFNRHHCSSNMDERTLHEIYLPAFKKAVREGKVATVMTAYNLINGIHASEHDYLNNDILKGRWEFGGFVISDWVSTYDGLACARGGLDLEMPSGKMMSAEVLVPAIESGELDESIIDDKVRRILTAYREFGLFRHPDLSEGYQLDTDYVRETALEAARGGIVLLKNEGGFLPLKKELIKTIAVIGPNGHPLVAGGGGSSKVDPLHPVSLVEALERLVGDQIDIRYEKGIFTGLPYPEDAFTGSDFYYHDEKQKTRGLNAEFFQGKKLNGEPVYTARIENLNLVNGDMWDLPGVPHEGYSARFTTRFQPEESGYFSFCVSGDDGYRLFIDGTEVMESWRDQGETRNKYECFLNGEQEYLIILEYYQGGGDAVIRLGVRKNEMELNPAVYSERALALASEADLVIMAIGFDSTTESESFDRSFDLPYKQGNLIRQITEANKNTMVILNAGGNVEMSDWIDSCKALLHAWYPGQEGNLAVTEILFGLTNPSGKLPVSFARKLEENPCFNTYFDRDDDKKVYYGEGIFMGYRYWDQSEAKPGFPFGFGLSYTSFSYSQISTDKKIYRLNESVKVEVTVKNTGQYDGAEVVQLYVTDIDSSLPRPVKELKDFEKVFIKAGEEKRVLLELDQAAFSYYDPAIHNWRLEPGAFVIQIGNSSKDIYQSVEVLVNK